MANHATGSATFGGTPVTSDQAAATVEDDKLPALSLDKTVTPGTYDSVGDVLSYSYLVTNTGNVDLVNVTVTAAAATAERRAASSSCAPSQCCASAAHSAPPRSGAGTASSSAWAIAACSARRSGGSSSA